MREYSSITVDLCVNVIESQRLLPCESTYTVEWCTAKYNLSTAVMSELDATHESAFRLFTDAEAGTRYLLAYRLESLSRVESELLKRVNSLLVLLTM